MFTFEYIIQLFFMKKILCKALLLSSLISSVTSINAQCSLDQVGSPNFVQTSTLSDFAVAPNGTVYTFAYNSGVNKFQLHTGMIASTFSLTAVISTSTSVKPAIAISKLGKISVVIRDENAGKVAKLYYLSGGTLLQQGPAISTGQVSDLSLAFNAAGEEVVAYTDIANANIATVKKWNGSAWVNVGTGTVSSGAAAYNSLIIDKADNPILAYQDATTAPANKISVKKFVAGAWGSLGVVSANPATNAKLKMANNSTNYYLGYTEISSSSAIVQMYNGSSWSPLGSPVTNLSTAAGTFGIDLDPTDTPVFTTILSTPPYPVSYKYTAGAWTILVSYINSSTAIGTNIMFDAAGYPYYFYIDQPNNNALNVKRTTPAASISTQPTSTITCNGGGMGYFYTGTVGGTPGYQWQVSSGGGFFANAGTSYTNATGSSVTFNPVTAMNQDVVRCVVNAGCINLVSYTATLTVNTLSVASTATNPTCSNTVDGAISTTVTGGSTPYTYTWSPIGGNNATATGLYGTTYTIATTDNIGCATQKTITLTTPPSVSSFFSGNQNICIGSATTLTVNASGGVAPYTYSWTPSVNIAPTTGSVVTANPTSSITYGVQITDAIGCVYTNTVGVNVNPLPSVSASASSSVICNGATTNLLASGSADTYTWNPGNLNGASQLVTPASTTVYTVTGTNTVTACTNTASINITVNPKPTANAGPTQTITCANPTPTLSGSTGGGVSYSWTGSGIVSGATTLNPVVNAVGTYDLTVVSAAGCSSNMVNTNVVQDITPPTVSASASPSVICNGSTTNLSASGSGSTYNWMPGNLSGASQVVTPSSSTAYTVTSTNAINGCTNTATVGITVNPLPSLTVTASSASICAGSTTTLTGTGATTYFWSPGGMSTSIATVSPASSTVYTLTGVSASGCSSTKTIAITVNPIPTITAGPTKSLTCASTFTVVTATSPGAASFNWNGPGIVSGYTTANCNVNAAGVYSVFAISPEGCSSPTATTSVVLNNTPPSPTAANSGPLTCSTVTVNLNGGPGTGVTYQWTGPGIVSGNTSQNAVANAAGNYTLKVTSTANSCTNTAITSVAQNTVLPSPTAATSGTLTCSSLTVALNGGPGTGVTYLWTGPGIVSGATTQNAVANAAGNYSLTVTNAVNSCTNIAVTSVTQNTVVPSPTATTSGTITCIASTAALNGGPGTGVTYLWTGPGVSGSPTTQNTSANAPGTYTLKVTSAINGCTNTAVTSVTQNTTAPSPTASSPGILSCINFTAALNGAPGAGVTYQWTGPGVASGATSQNAVANAPGIYSLSVTNIINGCNNTATTSVSQNTTTPSVFASSTQVLTCVTSSVSMSSSSSADPTTSYTWTSASAGTLDNYTISNPHAFASGVYTVAVTNLNNGCVGTETTTVYQNTSVPSANAGMDQSLTCSSTTLILSGSASPSSCTPVWTGGVDSGSNSYTPTVSNAGSYTLTVTDPANGCIGTDDVTVTSNAFVPTITVTVSNTLTCLATSVTASASTSAALPTYAWSGPGVVSGGSSNNATVNQPGGYTVTVTDIPTGCSATASITVDQDITLPVFSVSAVPSTICSGNSSNITATGASTYSWSTGQSSASITDSPVSTTVYSVTGYGTNGCSDVMTETVTVNATPSLSVTGVSNICKGSTANLTATGATTYSWSTGANTATISETPTVTTTYTVTGDNGACTASLTTVVSIITSKDITGAVTSTAGATTGDLILYKYTAFLSHWDSVTTVPLTSSFSFTNIDSAMYVIRAMPTATNIQVTYAGSSISWQNATVITHGCTNNSTQNIQLIGLDNIGTGPGQLSGTIIEGNGFGHRISSSAAPLVPGNPIGGIIVKGGKNPGGQMFTQTTTNSSGQYTLTGIPLSTGLEDYFIFVDIPGLDTNLTYHTIISSGNPVMTNLDFYVDSIYINPVYVTKVKEESALFENKVVLYPNPASQYFSIQYELVNDADVAIELYDMLGKKVSTPVPQAKQSKNKYSHRIETDDLNSGVYFVKLKLNGKDTIIKLILTK